MLKIIFEGSIFLHQKVGGISKYILELNSGLKRNQIDSEIIAPFSLNHNLNNYNKGISNFFKIKKIPRFFRKIIFFVNDLFIFFFIIKKKPNLIHFSYYNNSILKYLNIPYVLTVYDLIHENLKKTQKQFDKKKLVRNAKHIICISEQTKKDLIKFYNIDKKKITVIYLGIDEKKKIKKKIKKNIILFVGRRSDYKNFNNLLLAFFKSQYLKKNYNIICFGGEKPQISEVELIKKLNLKKKIKFEYGDDKKLNSLYNKSKLLVAPSLQEGFGLTLLESMKNNCPVACSDIKVFRELFQGSVIYFNPKNAIDMKKKIEKILKSKKIQKKLLTNGLKKIGKFSWKKCSDETSELYKKLV